MRSALAILVALAMALAGCTSDDDPAAPGPDQDSDGDDGSMSAANAPPQILEFTANVSSGDVPFDVTFDFNANDADGDDLSWALDVDGDGAADADGTALPSNHTATYDAEGTYNATLTVSDGENGTESTIAITATASGQGDDDGSGDDGSGDDGSGDDGDEAEEEPELEDRGDYVYDPATGMCTVKPELVTGEGVYVVQGLGGTWVFAETNFVAGLQVALNHPAGAAANPPVDEDCVDGDQVII